MANEYNTPRTAVEAIIDFLLPGHTDANIATYLTSQNYNISDSQLLHCLIVQMLDRIETLEAP